MPLLFVGGSCYDLPMNVCTSPYQVHVFICTNQKDNGDCCAAKGALSLHKRLKEEWKQKALRNVRINKSGCLGHCKNGIAIAIYPESKWILNVEAKDENNISSCVETSLKNCERLVE